MSQAISAVEDDRTGKPFMNVVGQNSPGEASFPRRPSRLLVSVRDADEARTAWRAGAHLIDAKEPARGPLGMCQPEVWAAIAAKLGREVALSAALGEWHEWAALDDAIVRERLAGLSGFTFAKLGPSQSGDDGGAGWRMTIDRLRALGPPKLGWIAVVYADGDECRAASGDTLLEHAVALRCAGILIDTCDKRSRNPWGKRWRSFVKRAQNSGMPVALAGGLDVRTIRRIADLAPDWFAVRGGACHAGQRSGKVSFRRVVRLVAILSAAGSSELNPACRARRHQSSP